MTLIRKVLGYFQMEMFFGMEQVLEIQLVVGIIILALLNQMMTMVKIVYGFKIIPIGMMLVVNEQIRLHVQDMSNFF